MQTEAVPKIPDGDPVTIAAALRETRRRTWTLMLGVSDDVLTTPAATYLSPPVWDLGHMANFEELWLVQRIGNEPELREGYNDIYNAFEHPREERPSLHLLDRTQVRDYMDEVRDRAITILAETDTGPGAAPLTRNGFAYWMLVLHEQQHQETLLQTLQMRGVSGEHSIPFAVRRLPEPDPVARDGPRWISVPGGPFRMGTPHGPGVYDNEAPPHDVDVSAFQIARFPVTCGDYLAFVEAGCYDDPSLWSERGQEWLTEEPHHAPLYWRQVDGVWHRGGIDCSIPVKDNPDEILAHVTYFEAEAYAKWAGARLPTEAEWEKACRWDPGTGDVVGRNPWGDAPATTEQADVDQLAFAPSRIGAFPGSASPVGCQHMIGDVWEWCASGFDGYPDFEPYPYDEYSKVFFGGDYRTLRGGSWATRAGCATGTFRNWDHPYRRQIFAGVRLARDA